MKNKENLINELIENYIKNDIDTYSGYYKLEDALKKIEENKKISYEECVNLVIKKLENEIKEINKQITKEIGIENTKKLLYLIDEEDAKADNEILHKYYILGKVKEERKNYRLEPRGDSGYYSECYDVVKHYSVKELCEKRITYQSQINYLNHQLDIKKNNNCKPKRQ